MTRNDAILLDWPALVAEAKRRRRQEKLTQKQHAALAGVSIPTIAAFDRGEPSLTLAKAFDILRVVGLVQQTDGNADAQDAFVQAAMARWHKLTETLPPDAPARFPHGYWRVDYCFDGAMKTVESLDLLPLLTKAQVKHTGWPPFWIPTRPPIEPKLRGDTLECWLAPTSDEIESTFSDAAHCDFWIATPSGRMFLMRGYQEDGQETFPAGRIFDRSLPIWRMGEVFLHSESLGRLIAENTTKTIVRIRAVYTGLSGRELRSWAKPTGTGMMEEGIIARSNEAFLEIAMPLEEIVQNLDTYITSFLTPLYERFDVASPNVSYVASELAQMKRGIREGAHYVRGWDDNWRPK